MIRVHLGVWKSGSSHCDTTILQSEEHRRIVPSLNGAPCVEKSWMNNGAVRIRSTVQVFA